MDVLVTYKYEEDLVNQRTNGPVNAHLISWPCKAQNIQNLENTVKWKIFASSNFREISR